jgi:hypothetical protein
LTITGIAKVCGGNDQPPAVLNPQSDRRRLVAATQSASEGAKALQLYQILPSWLRRG